MGTHPIRPMGLVLPIFTIIVLLGVAAVPTAFAGKYRLSRGDDLFYNYYVGPAILGGGIPAQMYPTPVPTPPLVGHTYITYQPFMPHEMMYKHQRTYTRTHPDGSATRTKVVWY